MKNNDVEISPLLQPHYQCDKTGVYFIDVVSDKDGTISEKAPVRLSDCIELIGRGRDQDGCHYRVIEWRDCLTHQTKTTALPMGEIGANWQGLLKHGLTVYSGRRKRELLADYLQTCGLHTAYMITPKCGWQKKSLCVAQWRNHWRHQRAHYLQRRHEPSKRLHRFRQPEKLAKRNCAFERRKQPFIVGIGNGISCTFVVVGGRAERRFSHLRRQFGRQNHRSIGGIIGFW